MLRSYVTNLNEILNVSAMNNSTHQGLLMVNAVPIMLFFQQGTSNINKTI